jgi:hypothetical protein
MLPSNRSINRTLIRWRLHQYGDYGRIEMHRILMLTVGSLLASAQAPAAAQVTVLNGKYTEGNIIRVVSRVKMPAPPASAYRIALLKVATMAGQKGFLRMAVVKVDDCVSIGINNGPAIVQTCKIFGQMVTQGEVATPKGKDPVKYYTLEKMNDGIFVPKPEVEGSIK